MNTMRTLCLQQCVLQFAALVLACLLAPPVRAAEAAATTSTERPRIYQLFLRQFSNTNTTAKPNGTLAENGTGKFSHLNDRALQSLRDLGITHLWLLGIPRHATATDYSTAGIPSDDPDLLKGLAGSPFAIRDYFDVCPDYATDPARRLEEFRELLQRAHRNGLKILIDCVPNHVARSYQSVVRPDLTFGARDDRARFFSPSNNFYYLQDQPPLRLPTLSDGKAVSPTCLVLGTCDGRFDGELDHAKVTGNNIVSSSPSAGDWYETIKLNYGHDFTQGRRSPKAYPTDSNPAAPIPDTWHKMDSVLAHWQQLGVDGFRCDMAHWIPMEFWQWAIARARQRQPSVLFVAEAYDNDPNKLTEGNVLKALISAGFHAVYDDQSYDILKDVYDGPKWANDLDDVLGAVAPLHESLRYAENHDEVRLSNPTQWGRLGLPVAKPVAALLFTFGRGPLLIYNGQEVGEPALGAEGFGGDDARTSIFDYWTMPELARWVNGHRYDGGQLSQAQRDLRAFYQRLLQLTDQPAFRHGDFIPLNRHNRDNLRYGRVQGETASGHWLYAFLRHDPASRQSFLVLANLHPRETLRDVVVTFPSAALTQCLTMDSESDVTFRDQLAAGSPVEINVTAAGLRAGGLSLPPIPPLTPWLLRVDR